MEFGIVLFRYKIGRANNWILHVQIYSFLLIEIPSVFATRHTHRSIFLKSNLACFKHQEKGQSFQLSIFPSELALGFSQWIPGGEIIRGSPPLTEQMIFRDSPEGGGFKGRWKNLKYWSKLLGKGFLRQRVLLNMNHKDADLNHISAPDEVMNGKSGWQVWPVVSPPGRYISYD